MSRHLYVVILLMSPARYYTKDFKQVIQCGSRGRFTFYASSRLVLSLGSLPNIFLFLKLTIESIIAKNERNDLTTTSKLSRGIT